MYSKFSNSFSLTDEIANIIRERILKGEYAIGEKIKENQIATELRVSRTPIREAFKILEEEHLIDYIPNRGCFARGFTPDDIDDIYAVRGALERIAMGRAIGKIKVEDIEKLEDKYDLMEFYTKKNDVLKILEIDTDFHDIIYSSTGSRFLAQVLKSYKEYIVKTRQSIRYNQAQLEAMMKEHKDLLDAIRKGDVGEAIKAIDCHIENSKLRAHAVYLDTMANK
ncbi:MAG: GntR family transcriptional regulator [Clostridia bacterium]|nr:GntR family transcriptional regulator [Clostridia bacterium]